MLDEKGNPDFQALQGAFDSSKTNDIAYFVFDLPYFGGYDLRRVPLVERRALLRTLLESNTSERSLQRAFRGRRRKLLEGACRHGLEGVIGKRADSIYTSKRSADWIKLKCTRRQEFVIGGYTDPKEAARDSARCSSASTTSEGQASLRRQRRHRLRREAAALAEGKARRAGDREGAVRGDPARA